MSIQRPNFPRRRSRLDRRPAPSHRHSGPSAPWPWVDLLDPVDQIQLQSELPTIPEICTHEDCGGCWIGYPQSRFPNWTASQVDKSSINKIVALHHDSALYLVDINQNGAFKDAGKLELTEGNWGELWERLIHPDRPADLRVRVFFVDNLSGPVLQMLGTVYNIEPFFFSSSLSWIPSRFQEEPRPGVGDHITITLQYLKPKPWSKEAELESIHSVSSTTSKTPTLVPDAKIDTQAPLWLQSEKCYLVLDLLSCHLVRNKNGNTLISYHHSDADGTSAEYLHERIRFAGQSVYWQQILQKSQDPTFVLLCFIWHAMYAWDESLERLYNHICILETQVIVTTDMQLTSELHMIRAHLLHYGSLLEDFRKAVQFIRRLPNPAMEAESDEHRKFSSSSLEKECENLLAEIDRLDSSRTMQDKRLKNVMNLVFSSVNILDSRRMKELTEAAVRDSAAMKQIAYLSMIFLPASFVATAFGMNIKEVEPESAGTLVKYIAVAVPLTLFTVWIVMAFQSKYIFRQRPTSVWMRLAWPVLLYKSLFYPKDDNEDVILMRYRQPRQ